MVACVGFLVGLIEIISEFAKDGFMKISLRLFGNLFAHEVLTVVLLGVFAFGLPAIWIGMGVFGWYCAKVSCLQHFITVLLTHLEKKKERILTLTVI